MTPERYQHKMKVTAYLVVQVGVDRRRFLRESALAHLCIGIGVGGLMSGFFGWPASIGWFAGGCYCAYSDWSAGNVIFQRSLQARESILDEMARVLKGEDDDS